MEANWGSMLVQVGQAVGYFKAEKEKLGKRKR